MNRPLWEAVLLLAVVAASADVMVRSLRRGRLAPAVAAPFGAAISVAGAVGLGQYVTAGGAVLFAVAAAAAVAAPVVRVIDPNDDELLDDVEDDEPADEAEPVEQVAGSAG